MTLIEWVFGIGGLIFSIGLAAYFGDYKLSGLWIGFVGATMLLFALALQIDKFIREATANPKPFAAEWKISVADAGMGHPMFVAHAAPQKTYETVGAADYLVVTNLQKIDTIIDTYKIEASPSGSEEGPWIDYSPISTARVGTVGLAATDIFLLSNLNLATAYGVVLKECGFDYTLLNKVIAPGHVVGGWLFFRDRLDRRALLRITLQDTKAATATIVLMLHSPDPGTVDAQPPGLALTRNTFDLSSLTPADEETEQQ